jgi:hypothetical protein
MAKATAKKPAAKAKTTAKSAKPKAPASKKTQTAAKKPTAKTAPKSLPATRRPPNNPDIPGLAMAQVAMKFDEIKTELDKYAAHLRALDRKRLNGVGMKKQGFIERAYDYAFNNSEFLPHYLTLKKFYDDNQYFINIRSIFETSKQVQEIIWNITIQSADIAYTDALEFYASVREAAKRRVDAAETIYRDLETFFKRAKKAEGEPTERKTLTDAKALIHGKRDGKIIIENVKPKLSGGTHKVVDEEFRDTARFREGNL